MESVTRSDIMCDLFLQVMYWTTTVKKIPKITGLLKTCPSVKPPLKITQIRHNAVFSRLGVFRGG